MPTTVKRSALGTLADQLGTIKAQIAELETREAELREQLIASGESEVEGGLFRVTVSTCNVARTDYRSVVESQKQTPALKRLITMNTATTERVQVRIVAR